MRVCVKEKKNCGRLQLQFHLLLLLLDSFSHLMCPFEIYYCCTVSCTAFNSVSTNWIIIYKRTLGEHIYDYEIVSVVAFNTVLWHSNCLYYVLRQFDASGILCILNRIFLYISTWHKNRIIQHYELTNGLNWIKYQVKSDGRVE